MQTKLPDLYTAEKLWHSVILNRLSKPYPFDDRDRFVAHTRYVARFAQTIAAQLPHLDADKAYIMGLLHDYGKRVGEKMENRFHAQEGYEEMLKLGYDDIAHICLTHTFHVKNFADEDYSYPQEWLDWAHSKLNQIEYTDYDRLIQLCDMLAEDYRFVTIEERAVHITKRYHLSPEQSKKLLHDALALKNYFDKLCNCDVYVLLGIK